MDVKLPLLFAACILQSVLSFSGSFPGHNCFNTARLSLQCPTAHRPIWIRNERARRDLVMWTVPNRKLINFAILPIGKSIQLILMICSFSRSDVHQVRKPPSQQSCAVYCRWKIYNGILNGSRIRIFLSITVVVGVIDQKYYSRFTDNVVRRSSSDFQDRLNALRTVRTALWHRERHLRPVARNCRSGDLPAA